MHPGQYLHKPKPIRRILQTQEMKEQFNSKSNELDKEDIDMKKKICLNLKIQKNDIVEIPMENKRNELSECTMNLWKCQQELQKEMMITVYLFNILQCKSGQQLLNKQEQELVSNQSSWYSLNTITQYEK